MIKKLWRKIFSEDTPNAIDEQQSPAHPTAYKKPRQVILSRSEHNVSRKQISKNAVKVLYRLNGAGFDAFLVGGGVRDILLGLSPKDFDIATNATPEQIKREFRNCRLIGRRFRLAHILFGREVIEVATFRAGHEKSSDRHAQQSADGMLVRDNVFGSLEEDAFRRDFTINALYYSAKDFTVIDYVGGLKDLERRQLRLIGDPQERYREDPVRILRAIRLSTKLNLNIEKNTLKPIPKLAELLTNVSSARLWDECNKLFLAGHAKATWQDLNQLKVARHLFPQTHAALASESQQSFYQFIDAALDSTDRRIANEQPVTPAFLFAVLLWRPQQLLTKKLIDGGLSPYEASQKAGNQVIERQRSTIAIPRRFSLVMSEIWSLQFQLTSRRKRNIERVAQHPRFRAAYDFLCLRSGEKPELKAIAQWWTDYQEVSPNIQSIMIKKLAAPAGKNPRRRKGSNRKRHPRRAQANHD